MTCAQLVVSDIPQITNVRANNDAEALHFLLNLQTRLVDRPFPSVLSVMPTVEQILLEGDAMATLSPLVVSLFLFVPAYKIFKSTCRKALLLIYCCAAVRLVAPGLVNAAPEPIQIKWFFFDPAVIRVDSNEPLDFTVKLGGNPSSVELQFADGEAESLTEQGDGVWKISVSAAHALFGYQFDDVNHNFVGFLDVFSAGTRVLRLNVFINVLDQNIPRATIAATAPMVQMSNHIVNIWRPDFDLDAGPLGEAEFITQQFYEHFHDDFDFINLVFVGPSFQQDRSHFAVQNTVKGIGLSTFNNTARYGSMAKLQGITLFPINTFFDLAETGAIHELGHQWINFLTLPILASGSPHWPISSLARGIMGFSIPPSQEGGSFPYNLVPLPNGDYQLQQIQPLREFGDLDLYLMGLLPPEEVGSHIIFVNQNQGDQLHNGGILLGPVQTVTVDDVIFKEGQRIPEWSASQKIFKAATILVTKERPLNEYEMAFFDYFAARGESTDPLLFSAGLEKGTTKPFFLAIGKRASLITCIVCVLTVALDIKPGRAENPINPKSNGVIPVAILSTNSFDASTVDQASLRFGPGQASAQGKGHLEDVNRDGLPDLVLHFGTQASGIQCGDTSVSITGQTVNGVPIKGSDSITTVGCRSMHR
jgi:hypothetical protein